MRTGTITDESLAIVTDERVLNLANTVRNHLLARQSALYELCKKNGTRRYFDECFQIG